MNYCRKIAVVIWVALGLMPLVASAEPALSATEMLQMYDDPRSKQDVALTVGATQRGLALANAAVGRRKQKPLYCPPPNLALTGEQTIDIVHRFVDAHPTLGKIMWEAVMLLALQEVFPCQE